jgi:hypothetical protein
MDIAKRIFQIHGVNKNGKTGLKKKLMRDQVLIFISNLVYEAKIPVDKPKELESNKVKACKRFLGYEENQKH